MLAQVHHGIDHEGRQRPEGEEDRAVIALDEADRSPPKPPRQDGQEDADPDEECLAQAADVPGPAAPEEGGCADRRLVELDGGGQIAIDAGQPQHRPEPGRRREQHEAEAGKDGPRPPEPAPRHAEPERAQDQQHRLAHPARQTEQHGRGDERPHAPLSHRPRADRDPGGERSLGGVGEADHAVRPEQRAHDEPERGQRRRRRGHRGATRAGRARAPRPRSRQWPDPPRVAAGSPSTMRGEPTERHVEDVARRVRLMPDHVVPLEGERELDRVPGRQEAHPVGPAGRQGQAGEGQGERPVRPRHRDTRPWPSPDGGVMRVTVSVMAGT